MRWSSEALRMLVVKACWMRRKDEVSSLPSFHPFLNHTSQKRVKNPKFQGSTAPTDIDWSRPWRHFGFKYQRINLLYQSGITRYRCTNCHHNISALRSGSQRPLTADNEPASAHLLQIMRIDRYLEYHAAVAWEMAARASPLPF